MTVAKETIINKMMEQLAHAKEMQHNEQKMQQHIANVRMLADLLLEESEPRSAGRKLEQSEEISAAEWKAMLGSNVKPNVHTKKEGRLIDDDGANGDSIFDF